MAESFKSKRVKFNKKGEQEKFILKAKNKLDFNNEEIAKFLDVCSRTVSSWQREKFLITLRAVKQICGRLKISLPKSIKIREPFWYVGKGAKKGGLARYKKYGSMGHLIKREKNWREWWEKDGQFKDLPILQAKLFNKPAYSTDLAEFVGIVLGDGGISERQITITLHRITDKKYFNFVKKLTKKLFNINTGIYKSPKFLADNLVISRTGLVKYCVDSLGLKMGNKIKNQADIPEWVKKNKKYAIACVRGLVDTDGSVYDHKYMSGGKQYSYKKMSFTSLSKPLLNSVYKIMRENNLNPGLHREKEIKLENRVDVAKYFSIFGSHNPKHLKRYKN